jgi:UDP-glucose:(heptosyl)LPS alpha-1,3-glucosyltransferase
LKDAYLIVVGDDARVGRYKTLAERYARGKVTFVGRCEDVERYYGAADVVALPSIQEAFGNVVLEGLASGLPVVVSKTVGAAELLKGEFTQGIVSHAEDPKELSVALASMLERAQRPEVSLNARRLGESYSWFHHFATLEQWLKEIVEQGDCVSSS